METLKKIAKHLNASCLLIVENDLKIIESEEEILSRYLILSDKNKKGLLEKLESTYKKLKEQLKTLDDEFNKISHTDQMKDLLSMGDLFRYLKSLQGQKNITALAENIKTEIINTKESKKIFFQYGLIDNLPKPYEPLFEGLYTKDFPVAILCFDDFLPAELNNIENDISSVLNNKKTFIAIVDNKLGDGDDDGVRIVKEDIKLMLDKHTDWKSFSVIFTSQTPPNIDPEFGTEYFRVIQKSENSLNDISKALSIIAFTKAFSYIHNKTTEATSKLPQLAQENRHNIAYIIDKANTEGMLPYEAIRIWNENATKYLTDKAFQEDMEVFAEIIGLTKLFNKNVLDSTASISGSITDIVSNEIFDYSVNSKYLPIAPGDIFVLNDKFYVVIGQACDLSLRYNLTRSSQMISVVEAEFIIPKKKKGKNEVEKVEKGKDYVTLNHFKKNESENGALKIELKTKSTQYLDYAVLDLCMYNQNGDCSISLDKPLDDLLVNYLTKSNIDNYNKLQLQFKLLSRVTENIFEGISDSIFENNSPYLASVFEENTSIDITQLPKEERLDKTKKILIKKTNGLLSFKNEDNTVTYPYKRICRIRGNFNYLIHHNYWNYRGRIDLNEINLVENNE